MSEQTLQQQAFKLKGRLYTLTAMQLSESNLETFAQQLQHTIQQAPRLFQSIPLVLDCTALPEDTSLDLPALIQCLRTHDVIPVAIQGANALITALAPLHGLAVLNGSTVQDKSLVTAPNTPEVAQAKCHASSVRSGQQVVSRGADLIVTGSVSPGAELLSDGHIHVYGALRGRALAGISGNKDARIFCQSLQAELIAIGGIYRLNDASEGVSGPCQVYLQDDKIVVESLCP